MRSVLKLAVLLTAKGIGKVAEFVVDLLEDGK
jgi:hypothetical protein